MKDGHFLLSDVERDRAGAELADHYAEGRLTPEEHAERLDRIWSARTRADLLPVFRDLPRPAAATPTRSGRPGAARGWGGRTPYAAPRRTGLRAVPTPLLVVLGVLLVLTVLTHLPVVLLGLLVWFFVARARHGHYPRRW
ncbi:DUF1707 SHOCT-like domain-containing protein [Nocardioides panaciterrulae]|uniref:DUF1707 domain-containing protein n=1 Tax=Nocardioides panaciterrulae TaxID=661492 RepID=A0A7Y9E2P7_9ACTN|nr:DUF1707 domain-containing protein [Nocardioides panaciterrulae]NYD40091.1 hypothetical protein [Nocardioides panaciterrulae]